MVCKGFESLSFSLAYSNFPNLKGSYLGCRQVVRHRVLIPTFRRFESSHSNLEPVQARRLLQTMNPCFPEFFPHQTPT